MPDGNQPQKMDPTIKVAIIGLLSAVLVALIANYRNIFPPPPPPPTPWPTVRPLPTPWPTVRPPPTPQPSNHGPDDRGEVTENQTFNINSFMLGNRETGIFEFPIPSNRIYLKSTYNLVYASPGVTVSEPRFVNNRVIIDYRFPPPPPPEKDKKPLPLRLELILQVLMRPQ